MRKQRWTGQDSNGLKYKHSAKQQKSPLEIRNLCRGYYRHARVRLLWPGWPGPLGRFRLMACRLGDLLRLMMLCLNAGRCDYRLWLWPLR